MIWGLQNVLHILVFHSVTSRWNPDYHTPISRGYPELSYGPNSLNISGVIRELEELEHDETFHWILPRTYTGRQNKIRRRNSRTVMVITWMMGVSKPKFAIDILICYIWTDTWITPQWLTTQPLQWPTLIHFTISIIITRSVSWLLCHVSIHVERVLVM